MLTNHFFIILRSLHLIGFATLFSLTLFAQKNSDGSYTIKNRQGQSVTYFPKHPGTTEYVVDTLAVGQSDLYFRIPETKKMEMKNPDGPVENGYRKNINFDGSLTTMHTSYPSCDCVVDTLEVEMPDGSFHQYFYVSDPKNILSRETILLANKQSTSIDVYENAEQMPRFLSGSNDLRQYIERNLRFDNGGKRSVNQLYMKFVVLQNGKIQHVQFDNTYGSCPPELEKELIQILENMPAWKPGTVYGKAVNAYYNFRMQLVF